MRDSAESIRRSTEDRIREANRHWAEEISRLEREKNDEIRRLQRRMDEQIDEYNRKLEALERKHRSAIAEARAEVAAALTEEKRRLEGKMIALRRETEEKIRAQERLNERKIAELRELIDRQISEIWARIDAMKEDERKLAEKSVNNAKTALSDLSKRREVRDFEEKTFTMILQPLVNESVDLYNFGGWKAAAHKAFIAEMECRRCGLEAEQKKAAWERRLESLISRVTALKTQLHEMSKEDYEVNAPGKRWRGCLRTWNNASRERFDRFAVEIENIEKSIRSAPPGMFDMLDTIEIDLSDLSRNRVIENYISRLTEQIRCCLRAYGLLQAFERIVGSGWTHTKKRPDMDRDQMQCSDILRNESKGILEIATLADRRLLERGQTLLRLRVLYRSSRPAGRLEADLDWAADELEKAINCAEYGYMRRTDRDRFRDGYPGLVIDFVPDAFVDVPPAEPAETPHKTAESGITDAEPGKIAV